MITIADTHHVTIDDKDAGHVIDAVRNNPTLAAEIKAAFDLWFIRHDSLCVAAVADAQADAASAKADAEVLGTKEEAVAMRKTQRRAEIQAQLDALDAPVVDK